MSKFEAIHIGSLKKSKKPFQENGLNQKLLNHETITIVYPDYNYIFSVDSGHDMCITFLFLCLKLYILCCIQAFIYFVEMKQRIEYRIAERKGKLNSF